MPSPRHCSHSSEHIYRFQSLQADTEHVMFLLSEYRQARMHEENSSGEHADFYNWRARAIWGHALAITEHHGYSSNDLTKLLIAYETSIE